MNNTNKVETSNTKRGRPKLEIKKDKSIRIRVDDDFLFRLDMLCKLNSLSRSEMIRQLVNEKMHKQKK